MNTRLPWETPTTLRATPAANACELMEILMLNEAETVGPFLMHREEGVLLARLVADGCITLDFDGPDMYAGLPLSLND